MGPRRSAGAADSLVIATRTDGRIVGGSAQSILKIAISLSRPDEYRPDGNLMCKQ